jgi:hypothetical protein
MILPGMKLPAYSYSFMGTPPSFMGTPLSFMGTPPGFIGTPPSFVGVPPSLVDRAMKADGHPGGA